MMIVMGEMVMNRKRNKGSPSCEMKLQEPKEEVFLPELNADKYKIVLVDKGSDEALLFLDLAHRIIRRKKDEDIIELSLGG